MNLPFTTKQFFQVIEQYNHLIFPLQYLFTYIVLVLGIWIFMCKRTPNRLVGLITGFLWIWGGVVYQLTYFSTINKAAIGFAILFIIQGGLLIIETLIRSRFELIVTNKTIKMVAMFFFIFGIVIYPMLNYLQIQDWKNIIMVGLPCPTTILTFSIFMLTSQKFPKYLYVIPTIWAIIGTNAAFMFRIYPDIMLIVSAIFAIVFLLKKKSLMKP
jgi:ABC-type antimicrobial peptide transport system permease subunit